MSTENSGGKEYIDVEQYRERLEATTPDGGGCSETWEAAAETRREGDESGTSRRGFLSHVSFLATGTVMAGAGALAGDAAAGDEPDGGIEKTELQGRKRTAVLHRAFGSRDLWRVGYRLGDFPEVHEVFAYESDDRSGYGVNFGDPEARGTSITFYDPEDGEPSVAGGTPVDDGIRGVTSDPLVTTDFGTDLVRNVAAEVPDSVLEEVEAEGTLERDRALLVQDDEKFDVVVPVVDGDELTGRVAMSAHGDPRFATTEDLFLSIGNEGETVTPQGHVVCGPWGVVCTDYCSVLCGALAGLAGAACASACAGTIAGIPISPACGAVCAGVVAGVCYPTCKNLAH